jgi:hypothetical protein
LIATASGNSVPQIYLNGHECAVVICNCYVFEISNYGGERRNHRPPPQFTGLKRKMSALSKYHGGSAVRGGTGAVKR